VLFRFSPAHRGESAPKKKKMVVVPRQRSLPAVEFFQKKGSSGRPPPLRQTLARGATRAVSARSSVASTAVAIDAGHASALRPTGVGVAERLSREPRWRSSGRPARAPILRSRVGGHSKIHRHRRVRAQRVLPRRWHRRENARDQSQQPRAGRPEHDLTLNFSKCEIVCADADVALFRNEFPEITSIVPVSSFFLLGTPLGSAEVARAKVEAAAERSTRRARLINALPDPVVATALLRHTTGFCIRQFLCERCGCSCAHMVVLRRFEAINFSLDEGRRELARLPTACGGFGLRSIADHCGIAFVAATVAAHELFPALLSQRTRDQLARSKVEMLFESNFLQKESFWFRCSVSSK
jgi:hypothetical protein